MKIILISIILLLKVNNEELEENNVIEIND